MMRLVLKEGFEKDAATVDFYNGGMTIRTFDNTTIECNMIIQEIYQLYKEIEKLKAFQAYRRRIEGGP